MNSTDQIFLHWFRPMIQFQEIRENGNVIKNTLIFNILPKVLNRSAATISVNMKVTTEYNPEKDIAFLSGEGDFVTFSKGSYGIFFPEDAHMPKIAVNNIPGKVKKVW